MNATVVKAFEVLQYISDHQGQVRLTDIVNALGMNKTTAFRFLETLEHLHLVEKKGSSYYLGLGLLQLGQKVHTQKLIIDKIHPLLQRLAQGVNETVNLAVLQDDRALYLHKVESQRRVQFRARLGDRLPLHCTALGKAILSIVPEARLEVILDKLTFEPMTKRTIRNREALMEQVLDVHKLGYAQECEEVEDGLMCVAVPLHIPGLEFYGAISMSGAAFRFTPERRRFLGKMLLETLGEVERALQDLF